MRAGVVVVAVVLQLVEVVAFAAVLREGAPALVADLVLVKCSAPCVKVPSGCSLMRMTFSCPFTMKVPSRAVVGAGQVSPLLAGTEEADVMPAGV